MNSVALRKSSTQFFGIACLGGLLCCLLVGCYGSGLVSVSYIALLAFLACATLSDVRTMTIPNIFPLGIALVWLAYMLARALGAHSGESALALSCGGNVAWQMEALQGLLGSVMACAVILAVVLAFEGVAGKIGLGGGDIKLLLASGLFMGFTMTLACLFSACVLASLVSVVTGVRKKAFSFGPYLGLSCMLVLLAGPLVLNDWFFCLGFGVLA